MALGGGRRSPSPPALGQASWRGSGSGVTVAAEWQKNSYEKRSNVSCPWEALRQAILKMSAIG